jgi:hypothetical protein
VGSAVTRDVMATWVLLARLHCKLNDLGLATRFAPNLLTEPFYKFIAFFCSTIHCKSKSCLKLTRLLFIPAEIVTDLTCVPVMEGGEVGGYWWTGMYVTSVSTAFAAVAFNLNRHKAILH